jgi:very-short-patch-repair endonuclease
MANYKNKIIPYRKDLKEKARKLRKHSTLSEILLWQKLQNRQLLGYQFHRQVPMLNYIVDFYCHELLLAIEVDGNTHEYKIGYDKIRQREIETYSVSFLRFDDKEVKQNIKWVLNEIYHWITERQSKHTSGSPPGESFQ